MMPLGVDHVQFSVPCLARAHETLLGRGFRQEFGEIDFDEGETVFFRERGKTMAFYSTEELRVELINGAAFGPGRRHDVYVPVFEAHAALVDVPELAATCRGTASGRLSHLEVHVDRPGASRDFWFRLGFRPDGDSSHRLAFAKSLAGMGLAIELCERVPTAASGLFVDDPGCSLVALVDRDSNATVRDLEGIAELWATRSFRINRRSLAIHLLRGPSGELVELIQLASRR